MEDWNGMDGKEGQDGGSDTGFGAEDHRHVMAWHSTYRIVSRKEWRQALALKD
jgi:hypothetical protein